MDFQRLNGYGTNTRLGVRLFPASEEPWRLAFRASIPGRPVIEAIRIVDPREPLPDDPEPTPQRAAIVGVAPCGADCDDAATILAAITEAAAGPIEVRLDGVYTLRTSLVIRRPWVHLTGGTVVWDPAQDQSWDQAIRFTGGGPLGEPLPMRRGGEWSNEFHLEAPEGWSPGYVLYEDDDYGEVPPPCANGRDVERLVRHIHQLLRVRSLERVGDTTQLTTDGRVFLGYSEGDGGNPRLTDVDLLEGARVSDLHLVAACPEALEHDAFGSPDCTNPGVVDDRGIVFAWTVGARADRVSTQAFGKEAIVVERALETRVVDCQMDHPARYGSGGQGYGVHTLWASRTLIRGQRVEHARHGVVVDFGSSETQILDGHFSDMNQALIDVHGEASRDTLIRGNTLRNGQQGVIVGGGGHEVHCNDGPHHYIQYNSIEDCRLAGISVSDYTRRVYAWFNDVRDGAVHVAAAFGAGDVTVYRNRFGPSSALAINLLGENTSEVSIRENLFETVCDEESAVLVAAGAEAPELNDNVWCPEELDE